MRKIVIGVVIAISVMAFSFAVADKLAQGSGGWFGPIVFLIINCIGLYCAYNFIIWYSKSSSNLPTKKEDDEITTLIRNKKRNGGAPKADL